MFFFDLQRSHEYSDYFWHTNFLSDAEIQQILKMGEKGDWNQADVYVGGQTKSDPDYRHASKCSFPLSRETRWIYEKSGQITTQCNRAKYHFDLSGILEPIAISRYEVGGHFDWHKDYGNGEISVRKLTLVVQLSHPEDYEGGDLEFIGETTSEPELKEYGTAVIFPSFVCHRVTPITSGQRISLVCWISGPPYR
jgi:PKHD-type hydroxylase